PGWLVVRVDQAERAHLARLPEVAREIRAKLRLEHRDQAERRELMALYDSHRDSLRSTAWKVRYAVVDTAAFGAVEPTAGDLDRYYRGHLADYSGFDPARGTITAQPFAEVKDEIRRRWLHERRVEWVRDVAEKIHDAWSHGRRDAAAERAATRVREVGPVPAGAPADTGGAGRALTDSLATRPELGVALGSYPGGTL